MKVWINFLLIFLPAALFTDAILKCDNLDVDYQNSVWVLNQNVSLQTTSYTLKSDHMTYFRKEKRFMARGNLSIFFPEEKRKINGEILQKNDQGKVVEGKPLKVLDKDGKRTITASRLLIDEKGDVKIFTFLESVRIQEENSIISGEKVVYNEKTGEIDLPGQATIQKPKDNILIESKNIDYNEKEKIAVFQNPVTIQRKNARIQGNQGKYNEEDDLIELKGDVSYEEGERRIQSREMYSRKQGDEKVFYFEKDIQIKEKKFEGTCDRIEYFEDQEVTSLKGDAVLKDTEKDLQISSTVMTINEKEDKIYFLGRIAIRQKDKFISGNLGMYDRETEVIEIRGNPVYRKGRDVSTAEIITLDTRKNEVTMKGNIQGTFTESSNKGKNNEQ
jgi:LPS export ABC transporter protein LptC